MLRKLVSLMFGAAPRRAPSQDVAATGVALLPQALNGLNWPDVGYGKDTHSEAEDEHWPTAYALMASAALRGGLPGGTPLTRDVGEHAIDWLLKNVGCTSSGLPVWGLPYGRQIWMDEGPCKIGTGFNVPTAHVIQALCEYAQTDSPQAEACKTAAHKAARAFVEHCSAKVEDGRIFWYSTLEAHSYHVMNAIALMAGEVQRVAQLCDDDVLRDAADEAIDYVLAQMELEDGEDGADRAPVWNYFGVRIPENKAQRRNDLHHEAFVCQGLLTYKICGGRNAGRISIDDIVKALAKFNREDQVFDFPVSEGNARRRTQLARGIGLTQSLYVLAELCAHTGHQGAAIEAQHCLDAMEQHIVKGPLIIYRPEGADVSVHTRTRAHIVLGLAQACHLRQSDQV